VCTKVVASKGKTTRRGFAGLEVKQTPSVFRSRRKRSGVRRALLPTDERVILVLDEEQQMREVLVAVLSAAYQVLDAPDVATALALAVRYKPAAVVTAQDSRTVLEGRLTKLLTLAMGYRAPPVVLVSGHHPRHLRDAKVDAIVAKPFVPDQLLRAVKRTMTQRAEAVGKGSPKAG